MTKIKTLDVAYEFEVLTVLLPVHNRGSLTASFVLHLSELLPDRMYLRVIILDDGCTDDTLINLRRVWPSVEVLNLDGSAFWGGAINAIMDYIRSRPLSEESVYLLANDDIRFPSKLAFLAGLCEVHRGALVCATGLLVQSLEDNSLGNIQQNLPTASQGIHYNSKTGNFEKATLSNPANVSSTYAMLATKDAWLSAEAIPITIPHYLSDYWLTYKLGLLGYKIVHPDNFVCLASAHTTRNNPTVEKKSWLKAKAYYLQSSLNKSSTSYFPAWIEFWSQKPIHPFVRYRILKLKLHKLVGSFLFGRGFAG
jgi:GT2 family glycosyltransferase